MRDRIYLTLSNWRLRRKCDWVVLFYYRNRLEREGDGNEGRGKGNGQTGWRTIESSRAVTSGRIEDRYEPSLYSNVGSASKLCFLIILLIRIRDNNCGSDVSALWIRWTNLTAEYREYSGISWETSLSLSLTLSISFMSSKLRKEKYGVQTQREGERERERERDGQ